jgi:NADH-quinone oxidoreductase subunit C
MSAQLKLLKKSLKTKFKKCQIPDASAHDIFYIECQPNQLLDLMTFLKTDSTALFEQLSDLCGVDYLLYGCDEWQSSEQATDKGFSRATFDQDPSRSTWPKPRFATVYHLLSLTLNQRIAVRCFLGEDLTLPSVCELWSSANWYEREAFDLFGFTFSNHPDLRRLLTDYGFIGHPFRKDFPMIGKTEIRYDAEKKACVYDPVSIEDRTVIPKIIPKDQRMILQKTLDKEKRNG